VTTSASAYTDFGVLEPAAGTLYAGAGTEAAPGQEDKLAAVHLPVSTTRTPVGYTGEQTNPAAGLQHYHARDYQPGLASWIQADTWSGIRALPATLNKYAYVLNNPATFTDWMGDRPWDPAYDVRSDGHGSWNLQPKPGVTTVEGNTPPSFNWANPGGPAPDPWVSNEPSGSTTQEGPGSHTGYYSGAPCGYNFYVSNVACRLPDGTQYLPGGGGIQQGLGPIDCSTDVKVGFDANQMAINEICGNALAEATMLTAPQWQRDLWAVSKGINGVLQPAVPLISITAGIGVAGSAGSLGAATEARAVTLIYDAKITGQMAPRGWTQQSISQTVNGPSATYAVWDYTSGTKQPATAYAQAGGGYVVVNDVTNRIVQVSDLNRANWKPVWEDPGFQR